MLGTLDIAVDSPATCPLRKCSVDPDLVPKCDDFCYCEILMKTVTNGIEKREYKNTKCRSEKEFPADCPLDKNNLNLWRSK